MNLLELSQADSRNGVSNMLIADDDRSTLLVLERMFTSQKRWQVHTVSDPTQFQNLFFSHWPSLVLLDLEFGNTNGLDLYEYEVLPAIRSSGRPFKGSIVLLTAVIASRQLRERVERLGLRYALKNRALLAECIKQSSLHSLASEALFRLNQRPASGG